MLCSTRKLTAIMHEPALAKIVRNFLDNASDVIARMVAMGRESVICAELIHRCYANADGDKYTLLIRGADMAMAAAMATAPQIDVPEAAEVRLQALDFLANYSVAKRASRIVHATPTAPPGPGPATVAELLTAAAIADFVTTFTPPLTRTRIYPFPLRASCMNHPATASLSIDRSLCRMLSSFSGRRQLTTTTCTGVATSIEVLP